MIILDAHQKELERRLRELEDKLENQRIENMLIMEKQDSSIFDKKNEIQACLNDYDHLLHNKCDVELEINTLKRLLDSSNVPDAPKKAIPEGISRDDLYFRLEREKAKTGNFQLTNFLIICFINF